MVIFLLKSSACLAIFLMFYKLLLEKEHMHTFKRYYLLAALVLALAIPSITFIEYVKVAPAPVSYEIAEALPMEIATAPLPVDEPSPISWPSVLWAIYILGVLFFLLRFIKNLLGIVSNIQNNPKLRIDTLINVLLQDANVPHTFFNYIFLNRKKFEANAIPQEVLLHEATHARQKHSLDVLFVEVLQIIFWFNPLIYLIKKSIKLNHEFLADEAVLNSGASTPLYQNVLLAFASSTNGQDNQSSLANAINYSSTRLTLFGKTYTFGRNAVGQVKKRFTVMKKHTSKRSVLLRSTLLLPLCAFLLFSFSTTITVEKESEIPVVFNPQKEQEQATPEMLIKYETLAIKYNLQPKETRTIPMRDLKTLETIYGKMSEEQKADALPFPECPDPKSGQQEGATEKQMAEYNALAKEYNKMLAANGNIRIKKSDVDRLEYLHGIMSEEQRVEAEPFPDFPEPPEPPAPPSPQDPGAKEFAENRIHEIIENQDPYDELNAPIWSVPSGANRDSRNVQDSAPIPPVAPTIATLANTDNYSKKLKNLINEYLVANRSYEKAVNDYRAIGKGVKQNLWNLYNVAMEKYVAYHVLAKEEGNFVQPVPAYKQRVEVEEDMPAAPPTPPEPKSPLDHIIEMAKKDAQFYYKGKEISADKAIDIIKKNKEINVEIKNENRERPVVKLSTEPITIEN